MKKHTKIAVIGSGLGSLTTASLLANDDHQVTVFEQNYLPGGCTSSYYRKGFIFETGATTVVGLGKDMPLQYLLDRTKVQIDTTVLPIPMQIILKDGTRLTRYHDLNEWIEEAEHVFGPENQRAFWQYCYKISRFVWTNSLAQKTFPPNRIRDLGQLLHNFSFKQLSHIPLSFISTQKLLHKFNLHNNERFVQFVNEQLLITAQNHAGEVNALFGATALCYTNEHNYYVYGGLIQLVRPFCEFIEKKGGQVLLKTGIEAINRENGKYSLKTEKGEEWTADYVVSGLPINNTLKIFDNAKLNKRYEKKLMRSKELNSAFQVGIGIKRYYKIECLHHQIHLSEGFPVLGGASVFVSFSHPKDWTRCPLDQYVLSITTHIPDPKSYQGFDKEKLCQLIFQELEQHKLLRQEDIIYYHASESSDWERWTKREWGFVGGYPQYMKIKPWEMIGARLDGHKAYICGDTTYPGQGIPGVCLSGINAYHKMKIDGLK
ncbi:MAG: NAD(P)-binding protein [Aureispira sp.]|nr:NAD(P)-binding protein [Aureispira sp.]